MSDKKIGAVLIVGGGIGGMQAALDLVEGGFKVYLVSSSPSIGGVMSQLDKTFPTNDCSMCILGPKMVDVAQEENIILYTYSEIESISGDAGNYEVKIREKATYVDWDKCTGCGLCMEKCPSKKAYDEYNEGLGFTTAISIPFPQAVPKKARINPEYCRQFIKGKCGVCAKICPANAIDYEMQDKIVTEHVGAIILATGFDVFNARLKEEYGYGRYDNVVTSIEFERMLSATGPYGSVVKRASDGEIPKKIAFIQCVGSRDVNNDYCSSVCCMYATKEAIIVKEHSDFVEPTIFYMDIRAFGKGFEEYYERAKKEHNIRYVRSMVSRVVQEPLTKDLIINYLDENNNLIEENFNMVVLSVGLHPKEGSKELAEKFGIKLNRHGFCETSEQYPVSTTKEGIYVCGVFQSPKDIPETVAQASGAACFASGIISDQRNNLIVKSEAEIKEKDISKEEVRIGVFVCHCGVNIGSVVNVPEVRDYAKTLPHVVYTEDNLFTCSQTYQERIKEVIKEHNLNRVVVASCSPRTHEPLFQKTIREAGLNKYLFEMANIRDQCSWVHMHKKEEATEKAKDLVRMAVADAAYLKPLEEEPLTVVQKGLVIGGGLAGMTAALKLAEQGFETYLIEKGERLGGNLNNIYFTFERDDIQQYLSDLIKKVNENPLIRVFTNTEIVDFSGVKGNFSTGIITAPSMTYQKLEHGITIVATGGEELKPDLYMYGKDERVLTQLELEAKLGKKELKAENLSHVVMIQCVGSRIPERPYCSRICCLTAIKNALKIKEMNPKAEITIIYRDIRTYGLNDEYYTKARKEGIIFVRYDLEHLPRVDIVNNNLEIRVFDPTIKKEILLNPNYLVLSTAILPRENEELAAMLKVQRTMDGFFLEAHMKLRPVEFSTDGIYMCGLAHFPKLMSESISQAAAAVSRSITILSKEKLMVGGVVAHVDPDKCAACLICVRVCPYSVPVINEEGVSYIDSAKCHGCGTCASECPMKAIELLHYSDIQILAKSQALTQKEL